MSEPTVHQAWAAVMADCRKLGKDERNPDQGFMYRGIDGVMNLVGPVLRDHGVAVVPSFCEATHRDVRTSRDKPAREATVMVTFTVYGPAGDSFHGMAPGESMDMGDKGTPKAMSVALRTFLLQSLCLPTQDTDPDAQTFERAPAPPDPKAELNKAKAEAKEAWEKAHNGAWNMGEFREAYEQFAASPIADADPASIRNFAASLRGEGK